VSSALETMTDDEEPKMIGDELEERVRRFAKTVVKVAMRMPRGRGSGHFADQMLRSATRAEAHYSEARSSESARDFVHKLAMVLKELRETFTWIDHSMEADFIEADTARELLAENDELIAIFCASRATAKRNLKAKEKKKN